MVEAITFLLKKGADPHVMDLNDEDACDKAKKNGIAIVIPQFNNCNKRLKKKPVLPKITDSNVRASQILQKKKSNFEMK